MNNNFKEEDFQEYSKRIAKKLEDDDVRNEFEKCHKFISDIYEYPITISIVMNSDPDNLDIIEAYNINEFTADVKNINFLDDNKPLKLNDIVNIINNEDNINKEVLIATKHLKPNSLNPVNGFMVLGMDDNIIIIPKNNELNEKD